MLSYLHLNLTFQSQEDVFLPEFKGSTLRGIFKTCLRRVVCLRTSPSCAQCTFWEKCPYILLTEHTTPEGENTVQPYAVACSDWKRYHQARGEHIAFGLKLFGRAAMFLPYVIASLLEWEKRNLRGFQPVVSDADISVFGEPCSWPVEFRARGRLKLIGVDQITPHGIFPLFVQGNDHFKEPCSVPLPDGSGDIPQGLWKVRLAFKSPTRIFRKIETGKERHKEKKVIEPGLLTFEILIRSLLTRLIGLETSFGGGLPAWSGDLLSAGDAAGVALVENQLRMRRVRRYRANNTRYSHMDGFTGEVVFENVPGVFIPLLQAGEMVHAGKFPTMGYGEYTGQYTRMT